MSVAVPYNRRPGARSARPARGDELPCIICAKPISKERQSVVAWIHVHDGGATAVTEAEANTLDSAGDLGLHPIGDDCLKRHPELHPYAVRPTR